MELMDENLSFNPAKGDYYSYKYERFFDNLYLVGEWWFNIPQRKWNELTQTEKNKYYELAEVVDSWTGEPVWWD